MDWLLLFANWWAALLPVLCIVAGILAFVEVWLGMAGLAYYYLGAPDNGWTVGISFVATCILAGTLWHAYATTIEEMKERAARQAECDYWRKSARDLCTSDEALKFSANCYSAREKKRLACPTPEATR